MDQNVYKKAAQTIISAMSLGPMTHGSHNLGYLESPYLFQTGQSQRPVKGKS